jgi:hypothetical protein
MASLAGAFRQVAILIESIYGFTMAITGHMTGSTDFGFTG